MPVPSLTLLIFTGCPQLHGVYVAFCPELDLATEGDTPEAALENLIEMALDYAEQYMAAFDRFSQSPNRGAHAPYIQAIHANPTAAGVRALFIE